MVDVWQRKYHKRNDWAQRAYDRFVAEVDPELVGDFTRSKHITVVVYGTTQVGKTTLILDLLGIRKEELTSVSQVLRGGQTIGRSSTASPIRYGRSPDDNWYVGDDPGGLNSEEAAERFACIRQQVMSGSIQTASLLNVRIPDRCFQPDEEEALSLDLRLIDIPGINAINKLEQNEVRRIAERYVASADLILLVGRADNLGFLHPRALDFEALNDWMLQPSRFRVVLTYTFSPASFQSWFARPREGPSLTVRDVQQHLYDEICTHDEIPPREMLKHIYPLEFGDSLESMRTQSQAYYEQASRVIRTLRQELLASITEAASPYARLWSAFRVGEFIEAKVARHQAAFDSQQPTLKDRVHQAQHRHHEFMMEFRTATTEHLAVEQLCSKHERRLRYFDKGFYARRLTRCFDVDVDTKGEETVKTLQEALQTFRGDIRCRWDAFWIGVKYSSLNLITDDPSPPSTQALSEIEDRLDDYWTNSYLLSSNFQTDASLLKRQAAIVCRTYAQEANKTLGRLLKTAITQAIQHKRRSEIMFKGMRQEAEQQIRYLQDAKERLLDAQQQHARFNKRMAQSLKHAHQFKRYIFEAFNTELDTVRRAIDRPGNSVEQLCNIFYLLLLPNELNKMLKGDES